ncbi:PREDICTED: nudix hydrolase 2 isoform X3 [Theobroma cacao]|uniref:Nudix hydrolase 2 isoform X3 n=1 Tax=Theobroma cacao TaxID=3641 RepID=A0AB32WIR7_THECC|nr:PREDICTED: nudix hydrolase 2 isoform X3 [Theobroma cacao]
MMLRRIALLGCTITNGNLSSLLGFSAKIPTWPAVKVSSSTAGYSIRYRAMSASANSTPVNVIAENEEQVQEFKQLNAVNDRYGGVIVEMSEPMDPAAFASSLRASIAQWRHQGKKGVWIKLPVQHVNLVEAAVKEGFWFHHAEPNYLMLAYWIPGGTHTLPANASHRVGVGAFVMNEKREVLVVQENTGRFRGTGVWKFPTGVVNEGEDLCTAAVREVKEETAWMPFEEYAAQPFVQTNELSKYIVDICKAKEDGKYSGFVPVPTSSPFSDEKNYMYFNYRDLNGQ